MKGGPYNEDYSIRGDILRFLYPEKVPSLLVLPRPSQRVDPDGRQSPHADGRASGKLALVDSFQGQVRRSLKTFWVEGLGAA